MANLTQAQIEDWITNKVTGVFHYTKVMDGTVPPTLWPQLRAVMFRCKDKGIAFPVEGRDGWWRKADREVQEVCWWETDGEVSDNLLLPLGLNKYCYIPTPSLIIVAGKYNSGKTAFCINLVNLNLEKWANKLNFFVSEGAEMMGVKLKNLNSFIPKPPPFKMYRRTENFADVIEPDSLNVIDYLRCDMSQTYAVGQKLFEIFNKLKTGIAVVAMQKPPGDRKLAYGGAGTAFEPTLYIAMDKDWLGFEKIKVPKIVDHDPYAVKIQFRITHGVNFEEVHEVIE